MFEVVNFDWFARRRRFALPITRLTGPGLIRIRMLARNELLRHGTWIFHSQYKCREMWLSRLQEI